LDLNHVRFQHLHTYRHQIHFLTSFRIWQFLLLTQLIPFSIHSSDIDMPDSSWCAHRLDRVFIALPAILTSWTTFRASASPSWHHTNAMEWSDPGFLG
jgi:hypothetical protein